MIHKYFTVQSLYYASLFFIFLASLYSFYPFVVQAMNVDIAYLCQSAERMLRGVSMTDGFYDTNPPLSVMLYIPAVLLNHYSGLPIYYCITVYGLLALSLSAYLCYALLKTSSWLCSEQIHAIVMSYVITNLVFTGVEFGQREHFLIMACAPLFLLQIMKTYKVQTADSLGWISLIWGAVFILLKPHYGIIPACIFIHRAFIQKRLNVIFDADFIALTVVFFLYMAVLFFFFDEFLFEILPDVLSFYMIPPRSSTISDVAFLVAVSVGLILAALKLLKKPDYVIVGIGGVSCLCALPIYLQGYGFAYHIIPTIVMIFSGSSLFLFNYIWESQGCNPSKKLSCVLSCGVMLFLGGQNALALQRVSHQEFKETELVQTLKECSGEKCSFFMFNNSLNIIHELSVYSGQEHASRFPVMWFMPYFIQHDFGENDEEIKKRFLRYLSMINEDLLRYKPDTLLIAHPEYAPDEILDFVSILSAHSPEFVEIMQGYKLEEVRVVDRAFYIGGAASPDIGVLPTYGITSAAEFYIYKRRR